MVTERDPICGMMIDEKKAEFKSDYNGKTYYFCAAACKKPLAAVFICFFDLKFDCDF